MEEHYIKLFKSNIRKFDLSGEDIYYMRCHNIIERVRFLKGFTYFLDAFNYVMEKIKEDKK